MVELMNVDMNILCIKLSVYLHITAQILMVSIRMFSLEMDHLDTCIKKYIFFLNQPCSAYILVLREDFKKSIEFSIEGLFLEARRPTSYKTRSLQLKKKT